MASLIRFQPLYQTRVWGGRQLESQLGRALPEDGQPYGESWDLSDREADQSVVISEGPYHGLTLNQLWTQHREAVFGSATAGDVSARFPLLMKVLDAQADLSIQVHPPAAAAAALGGETKTEMWVVAHAEPGARIYAGLKKGVTRDQFEQAVAEGTVADCVHVIEPRVGDCLFIPSGRIHAIGAGLLIYEIQQNSDTTYRVFDWNRVGLDGQPRQLHLDESMASIDFNDFEPGLQPVDADGTLVDCECFRVNRLRAPEASIGEPGEAVTLALIRGSLTVDGTTLRAGDFALLPADTPAAARAVTDLSDEAEWLEVRLP